MATKTKIYKIRLNERDAEYGISTPDDEGKLSQAALEAWTRAMRNTLASIISSLPKEMQRAIATMRENLPLLRPDCCCTRCGGAGIRDDKKNWIEISGEKDFGKICFRCAGSGIEPHMEPGFFRRRAVDSLVAAKPSKAIEWANKVLACEDNPYRPVILDLAEAILAGQDPRRLPH